MMAVRGFSRAESRPTRTAVSAKSSLASAKRPISSFCLEKARITRAPSRFSRVIREILSSFLCMTLKNGTDRLITTYKTRTIKGKAMTKIRESCTSTVKAMTTAPMARKGARTTSRISMATAVWS